MNTVWKFTIPIQDEVILEMPVGAKVLTLDVQSGTVCLWALVDTDNPTGPVHFRVHGTGHRIDGPEDLSYVGSFQMYGGDYVGHVFQVNA